MVSGLVRLGGWIGVEVGENTAGAGVIRGWGGGKTWKAILSRFDRWWTWRI